jgi:23S rRNA (guanosine2251-2'-O)-methyltransferase
MIEWQSLYLVLDHHDMQIPMTMPTDFIYGKHPVLEFLANSPMRAEKLYLRKGLPAQVFQEARKICEAHSVPIQFVPEPKLASVAGRKANHQGFVLKIASVPYLSLEEGMALVTHAQQASNGEKAEGDASNAYPALLVLEEIEDPHNLGAMIRTATAVGVSAIIVSSSRQAPLSGAVMKASAGTLGMIPIIRVDEFSDVLEALKDRGFHLTGLAMKGSHSLWELELNEGPMAFVIGNEGAGLRKKTAEQCDFLVHIPMDARVESLNASVSASVICYEWSRQSKLATTSD